jgi:molybdopterin synthase sulfur carrier subunit
VKHIHDDMPRVAFTANLQRHISAPPSEVSGRTVRAALESVFAANPRLRSYVLDDQGRVRHHVVVFIGGQRIQDPVTLSDPVGEGDEIFVMQALSGG